MGTEEVLQRARRSTTTRRLVSTDSQAQCHFCPRLPTLKVGEDVFCMEHAAPVLGQALKHSVLRDRHLGGHMEPITLLIILGIICAVVFIVRH